MKRIAGALLVLLVAASVALADKASEKATLAKQFATISTQVDEAAVAVKVAVRSNAPGDEVARLRRALNNLERKKAALQNTYALDYGGAVPTVTAPTPEPQPTVVTIRRTARPR
jgi:uncharacterized membrane protein